MTAVQGDGIRVSLVLYCQKKGPGARGGASAAALNAKESSAAYPTEERIRWKDVQKMRKAKGVPVVKRKQVIEDHWDDCGQDLSGLAGPDDLEAEAANWADMNQLMRLPEAPAALPLEGRIQGSQ